MPSISIGTSGSLPFGTQTLMLMACVLMAFAGSICKIDTIAIHGMTWRPAKARNSHLVDQNCTLGTSDWLRKAGRDKSEASAMALPLQIALKTGPECHQSALAQVAACLLELRHSCWWHVYWWNKANLLRISELFWFSSFFFIYYTFIQPCSDVSPLPTTNTQWGYCHATCCNFQYIKKTTLKYSAMTHFFFATLLYEAIATYHLIFHVQGYRNRNVFCWITVITTNKEALRWPLDLLVLKYNSGLWRVFLRCDLPQWRLSSNHA